MSEDEYEIKPILEQFNITNELIVAALNRHLDKKITVYLRDRDTIRKSAFTEMRCCLHQVLIDSEADNDETLRERILGIVDKMT